MNGGWFHKLASPPHAYRIASDVLAPAFAGCRFHDHGNLHGFTLGSYPAAAFAARRSVMRAISSETR